MSLSIQLHGMTETEQLAQAPITGSDTPLQVYYKEEAQKRVVAASTMEGYMLDFLNEAKQVLANTSLHLPEQFWQEIKLTLSMSSRRKNSRGGANAKGPFVNIAARHWMYLASDNQERRYNFFEYAQFAKHPVIGSVFARPRIVFNTLCAHELSHAIQYAARVKPVDYKPMKANLNIDHECLYMPHGRGFRAVYAEVRTLLINGHL